jgi:hypothetical protein
MALFTPGVDFLAKGAFILSLPAFAAYALGEINVHFGGTPIPTWILVSGGFISVPAIAASRIILTRLRHKREAAALGAKMIPCATGKWPGNVDILQTLQHNFLHGYPGIVLFMQIPPSSNEA